MFLPQVGVGALNGSCAYLRAQQLPLASSWGCKTCSYNEEPGEYLLHLFFSLLQGSYPSVAYLTYLQGLKLQCRIAPLAGSCLPHAGELTHRPRVSAVLPGFLDPKGMWAEVSFGLSLDISTWELSRTLHSLLPTYCKPQFRGPVGKYATDQRGATRAKPGPPNRNGAVKSCFSLVTRLNALNRRSPSFTGINPYWTSIVRW